MFNLIKTFLLLLIVSSLCKSRTVKIKCSEFCFCDTYLDLKRATCQSKRLISIEINMSPEVEILDLAYNQISEFGDKIFKDLEITKLQLLNVSHNKISHIHFNAFEGLNNLKTLDLSFNALRYITKSWFRSLTSLEELYLKGNLLRTINEQPHIESTSLKILDLSESGITHLKRDIFVKVPNIEILDLSGNFLVELKPEVVITLENLTVLDIINNHNFNCKSMSLHELRNYRKNKGFALKQPCTEKILLQKSHMFEKMVMKPKTNELDLEKNSWIFEKKSGESSATTVEVCSNGTSNEERFRKTFSTEGFDGFLMQIVILSPTAILFGLLGYGIFIGIIFGCFCHCDSKKRNRRRAKENLDLPDGATTFNSNLSRHSLNNLNTHFHVDHVAGLGFSPKLENPSKSDNKQQFCKRQRSTDPSISRSNSLVKHLRRSKSIGSKPSEECENLMTSEFSLPDSTPVTPRKVYDLQKNLFMDATSE